MIMDRTIKWDITYNCNLRCKHCYNNQYFNKIDDSTYTNQSLLETMDKLIKIGITRIHFLGGEPLISPKILPILYMAQKKNITTTITTNGLLLSAEMSHTLFDAGLSFICVSLDGVTAATNDQIRGNGTFDIVKKNIQTTVTIRNSINSNTKIYITLTMNRLNVSESSRMLEFIVSLGVDGLLIASIDQEGGAVDNWEMLGITVQEKIFAIEQIVREKHKYPNIYLEIVCKNILSEYLFKKYSWRNRQLDLEKSWCNGTDEEYYIKPNGDILPCRSCDISTNQNCLISHNCNTSLTPNIYKNSSKEILDNTFFKQFYAFTRDINSYKKASKCLMCKYSYKCLPCPLKCDSQYLSAECEYSRGLIKQLEMEYINKKVKINDNILFNSLYRGQIRVLNIETQDQMVLEDVGAELWNLLSESDYIVDKLIKKLYQDYAETVQFSEFQNDLLDYIFDLRSKGLLEII